MTDSNNYRAVSFVEVSKGTPQTISSERLTVFSVRKRYRENSVTQLKLILYKKGQIHVTKPYSLTIKIDGSNEGELDSHDSCKTWDLVERLKHKRLMILLSTKLIYVHKREAQTPKIYFLQLDASLNRKILSLEGGNNLKLIQLYMVSYLKNYIIRKNMPSIAKRLRIENGKKYNISY